MHLCVQYTSLEPAERPQRSFGFPETGVTDGCEQPWGCWEFNLGPLKQQTALTAEPSPVSDVCQLL